MSEPSGTPRVDDRNGDWLDKLGCCKLCDGEIPDGHTNNCHIWKLEHQISALKQQLAEAQEHYSKCNWSLQETLKQRDAALAELAPYRAAEAGMSEEPDWLKHCDWCGWPLKETIEEGCVESNCSMRPLPETDVQFKIKRYARKLRARCVALEAKMQGKVLVPEKPTEAMREAAKEISDQYPYKPEPNGQRIGYLQIGLLWKAMLAAAKRGEAEES